MPSEPRVVLPVTGRPAASQLGQEERALETNWARRESQQRFWDFNPTARPYATLHPAERFSDRRLTDDERRWLRPNATPETRGGHSRAVTAHQTSTCTGWKVRPTSGEFYAAIRAEQPSERERDMLAQWVQEADWQTIMMAYADDVYTIRELVAALHRAGMSECRWSRKLNKWARPAEARKQ